jgi:isoquinoline 1-oxidoreductase beta subunit
MSPVLKVNRRDFLRATAAAGAGGLLLAFNLPCIVPAMRRSQTPQEKSFSPNAYLKIGGDGRVTVWVVKSEMGQGVRTSLPMILAEELEADWSLVELAQAVPGPAFRSLRTAGSWSIGGNWRPLRQAGATAREMLITAASNSWKVERTQCRAERGAIIHRASGRRLPYGALVEEAAKLPVPAEVPLKEPKDFKLIGQRIMRLDGPSIVSGAARYGLDVRVAGMLYATVVRSPVIGGKLLSWNDASSRSVPGVRAVVRISTGVAVVADNTWTALKGREALAVSWDEGPHKNFDSVSFWKKLATASRDGGQITRQEGEGRKAFAGATKKIDAVYQFPFQAHAPLETMNCLADVRANSCELWVPTQAPDTVQAEVAKLLGFKPEAVRVNVTLLGGGFGRRLGIDYAIEAVEISRATKAPVQVAWTRADDMQHGFFQPASLHHMEGAFDRTMKPLFWAHKMTGSLLTEVYPADPKAVRDGVFYRDYSWGVYDVPYGFPAIETAYISVETPVPTGPWRAVHSPAATFARECFMDELAHAAGRDPLQFRLDLLQQPTVKVGELTIDRARLARVLKLAAQRSVWGTGLPAGRGRGLACNMYDGETCIAYVAEVSVSRRGEVKVERVVCAVDCGTVVHPGGVEAQIEGGIHFGLSAALHGQITFRNGRVEQSTYRDFPVMRMPDTPVIETHIIPGTGHPTGVGEQPVPPIIPAVLNAIFMATGKRLRRIPVRAADFRADSN